MLQRGGFGLGDSHEKRVYEALEGVSTRSPTPGLPFNRALMVLNSGYLGLE